VRATLSIPLALAVSIGLAAPSALAQQVRTAPAPWAAAAASVTDRAAGEMARLLRARVQKLSAKRLLERTYEAQLRQLDRLKRRPASWNRDRQIRASKSESQSTAARLSSADLELRAIDDLLLRQRRSLVAAIDRELAARPAPARRALLERMRAHETAASRPRVRKILVPDDTLDQLADPDELAEQIALIEQAEQELRREREVLRQREQRYERMARLRQLRERASEMGELEDEVSRRSARADSRGASTDEGRPASDPEEDSTSNDSGGGNGLGSGEGGFGEAGGGGGSEGSGGGVGDDGGFEQSSILLTDVVDSSTIDALRRAGRSSSPMTRAEAAAGARKQVEARLQRFARSRALIQRHLGKLRRGQ
jgi:hypothetical protein